MMSEIKNENDIQNNKKRENVQREHVQRENVQEMQIFPVMAQIDCHQIKNHALTQQYFTNCIFRFNNYEFHSKFGHVFHIEYIDNKSKKVDEKVVTIDQLKTLLFGGLSSGISNGDIFDHLYIWFPVSNLWKPQTMVKQNVIKKFKIKKLQNENYDPFVQIIEPFSMRLNCKGNVKEMNLSIWNSFQKKFKIDIDLSKTERKMSNLNLKNKQSKKESGERVEQNSKEENNVWIYEEEAEKTDPHYNRYLQINIVNKEKKVAEKCFVDYHYGNLSRIYEGNFIQIIQGSYKDANGNIILMVKYSDSPNVSQVKLLPDIHSIPELFAFQQYLHFAKKTIPNFINNILRYPLDSPINDKNNFVTIKFSVNEMKSLFHEWIVENSLEKKNGLFDLPPPNILKIQSEDIYITPIDQQFVWKRLLSKLAQHFKIPNVENLYLSPRTIVIFRHLLNMFYQKLIQ